MRKVPNVFVIVYSLTLLVAMLTWIVPGGKYERTEVSSGGTVSRSVIPESFRYEPSRPQVLEVFTAPIRGFLRPGIGAIVIFIFIVGGSFFVLNETGTLAAAIQKLAIFVKGREMLIIPVFMTTFSFFGAAFGMFEEAMPFVFIFVPLAIALGYDSLVGVSLSFVGGAVGFGTAFLNPFTLQIAQGLAGLQPVSGWKYRVLVWFVATSAAIAWVMVYAARIKADPTRSLMYELDAGWRKEMQCQQLTDQRFTLRHALCLILLLVGIVAMIAGVVAFKWFIVEIAGLLFAVGIIAGVISGMGPNALADAFVKGCREIAPAALIVGFASGIVETLDAGNIMDTILHAAATVMSGLPKIAAAHAMYIVQMILNCFIPSGSTKAALTMPIMAPLADLSGITRQTAVLAFQLGDGFTNMIVPTLGVTVGTLAMARVPFDKWFRWNLPMQGMFFVLSLLFLVWPVLARWQ